MPKIRFAQMGPSERAEARQGYRDAMWRMRGMSPALRACESREASWDESRGFRTEWSDVDIGCAVSYAAGRELATARYADRLS